MQSTLIMEFIIEYLQNINCQNKDTGKLRLMRLKNLSTMSPSC